MTEFADLLPYLVAVWLVIIGLYGMAKSRNLIHLIMCFAVFQSSVWLLLLTVGFQREAYAPIFDDVPFQAVTVDPVMQALSITNIVVSAAVLAILLALAIQIKKKIGSINPENLNSIRG